VKKYRVLFWIELEAIDREDAEKKAKKELKSKKIEAELYSVEEG